METKLNQLWDMVDSVVYVDPKQSYEVYKKWASTYDEDYDALKFVISQNVPRELFKHIRNAPDTLVLDVGAGTGRCAEELKRLQFEGIIDAVDINPALLDVAKSKAVYRNCFECGVYEDRPLPVKNGTYDAVMSAAALVTGHIDAGGIMSMIQPLKPGGVIVFNLRTVEQALEYKKKVEEHLEKLVVSKTIEKIDVKDTLLYEVNCRETGAPMESMLYIYRKC